MTKMKNSVTTYTDASLLDDAVLDRLMEQVEAEGLGVARARGCAHRADLEAAQPGDVRGVDRALGL